MKRLINHLNLTDHTEYEEYHKLQLCTVFRDHHNNTLGKISSNYRYWKNPQNIEIYIFFQYRTPLWPSVVGRLNIEFTRFIRTWNSLHSRMKFTTQQTRIRVMGGGLLPGSSSLIAKCIPVFVKVRSSIVQLWVPTYNHNSFVLHCCFGFSVTARASSWLVNAAWKSAKVQIFQIVRMAHQTLNSRRLIRMNSAAGLSLDVNILRVTLGWLLHWWLGPVNLQL